MCRVTEAPWRMLQRPLCCSFAAFSWFWGLVSSQYLISTRWMSRRVLLRSLGWCCLGLVTVLASGWRCCWGAPSLPQLPPATSNSYFLLNVSDYLNSFSLVEGFSNHSPKCALFSLINSQFLWGSGYRLFPLRCPRGIYNDVTLPYTVQGLFKWYLTMLTCCQLVTKTIKSRRTRLSIRLVIQLIEQDIKKILTVNQLKNCFVTQFVAANDWAWQTCHSKSLSLQSIRLSTTIYMVL